MNISFIITTLISLGFLVIKVLEYRKENKELAEENKKFRDINLTVNYNAGVVVGSDAFLQLPKEIKEKLLTIQSTTAGTIGIMQQVGFVGGEPDDKESMGEKE